MPTPSFAELLANLREGEATLELDEALRDAALAVKQTQKTASITVTLTLSPMGEGRLKVADKINLKTPEPSKEDTLFFVTESGMITRRNPRQMDLTREFDDAR